MLTPEVQLGIEIEMMTARSDGRKACEIGRWGSNDEEVLWLLEEFRCELDDWPGECQGSYEEYAHALSRTRLEDVHQSPLPPKWKEFASGALLYALFARISELESVEGLPPAVLLNRLGDRTGGAIGELCEVLRHMNPDEARERIEKWLSEIQTGPGRSVNMYCDVTISRPV